MAAVVALVLGAVLWLTFERYRDEKEAVRDEALAQASGLAFVVDGVLTDHLNTLRAIALSPDVAAGDRAAIERQVMGVDPRQLGFSGGIGFADLEGQLVLSYGMPAGQVLDLSERAYVQDVLASWQPVIGRSVLGAALPRPLAVLAVPVGPPDARVGVLIGTFVLDRLESLTARLAQEHVTVLDGAGQVVFDNGPVSALDDASGSELLALARGQGSGVSEDTNGIGRDERQLAAFAIAGDSGWVVVVQEDHAQAFGAARTRWLTESGIAILCAATVVPAGWGAARRLESGRQREHRAFREAAAARDAAEAAKAQVQRVLNAIPNPVWTLTPDGTQAYLNTRAAATVDDGGRERSAFRISRDDVGRASAAWQTARADGTAVVDTYRMGNPRDGYRTHLVHIVPLLGDEGEVTGWVGTATDIQERVDAEDQRREADRRFRELTNAIPAICWASDREGRVEFLNGFAASFTGRPIDELLGLGYAEVIHPDDVPAARERFREASRRGEGFDVEYRMRTADGTYRWQLGRAVPLKDDSGAITGWIGALVDIHDARERQEERLAAAQRFRQLADSLPVIAWVTDAAGNPTYVNKFMVEYSGVPETELLAGPWLALIHPDEREELEALWADAIAKGEPFERAYRLRAASGQYRWQLGRGVPVRDAHGAILEWVGTSTDIHDQKEAELAAARLAAIVTTSADAILTLDTNGRVTTWNPAAEAMFGWSAAEMIGQSALRLAPPELREEAMATWAEVNRTGIARVAETRRRHRNGEDIDVSLTASLLRDAAGQPIGVSVFIRDVRERARQEARLRALLSSMPAKVAMFNASQTTRWVNEAWVEYTGVPAEQLAKEGLANYVPPPGDEEVRQWRKEPRPLERQALVRNKDGEYRWHLLRIVQLPSLPGDTEPWFVSAAIDIHAIKEAEASLVEAIRSKDDFLGLVSHELRTPLTQVYGNAEILVHRGRSLPLHVIEETHREIYTQARRLRRLIDNMLTISRLERGVPLETEPLLVQRLLPATLEEFRRRMPFTKVIEQVEPGLPPVETESTTFDQVLWNLLTNAAKYGPPDGPIHVSARLEGNRVVVAVRDHGRGLPPQEIERVFEPYFRSRSNEPHTSGLGLGLAVCRRLVEAQSGEMFARRIDGGGMEFGFSHPALSFDDV